MEVARTCAGKTLKWFNEESLGRPDSLHLDEFGRCEEPDPALM
jgi:hypothetical protein